MAENRIDRVSISKEGQLGRTSAAAPGWITPVLKRFYDFTRKWAKTFSGELNAAKREEREEELIKAVNRSFKGEV
jgi:oxalate decarboxylase/phosphoglucose isomerase-like protein (cupin superfamily)